MARDICAALGGFRQASRDVWESEGYVCTAARGHLLELCEPHEFDAAFKHWSFKLLPIIPERFRIKPKPDVIPILERIRGLVERHDVVGIVNACDAAREGELIFREILAFCRTQKPVERVWLQSLTAEAIRDGFAKLRPSFQYDGLANAAACRAKADWLIGLNSTRALTLHMRRYAKQSESREVYPAGRVQTPTLALIVRRWNEIRTFKPVPFSRIEVALADTDGEMLKAHVYRPGFKRSELHPEQKDDRWFDKDEAHLIVEKMLSLMATGEAAKMQRKVSTREQAPPALFHLTALQQTMAQRHGWTAKRTLESAQRCYEEHKILTYPRTDSPCLPSDLEDRAREIILALAGIDSLKDASQRIQRDGMTQKKVHFDDSKVTDHHAIVPTGKLKAGITHNVVNAKSDDALLFEVVARRFLAAFHPPAKFLKIERKGSAGSPASPLHLRVALKEILMEPGWLATYGKTTDSRQISAMSQESRVETMPLVSAKLDTGSTKPPPAIDEAALLRLMQFAGRNVEDPELAAALTAADGLGTPATRAEIIENLKYRKYVTSDLTPTEKGEALIQCLERLDARRLTSAELTAELELQLSRVQKGDTSPEAFMGEVHGYTREIVNVIGKKP